MKIQRWRINFSKTESMRFTGHLDLILTWERTFRRSRLPLSYSEGYSPRPIINLAAPLPLGFISRGEIGDFWLSKTVEKTHFQDSLTEVLPPGLQINHVQQVSELHGNKLPTLVRAARYSIELDLQDPSLPEKISRFMECDQVFRERKGKHYDLRSLVHNLEVLETPESEASVISTIMSLLPGATGRPDELLNELGLPGHRALICREETILDH
jgi:radical SAM-linked protein